MHWRKQKGGIIISIYMHGACLHKGVISFLSPTLKLNCDFTLVFMPFEILPLLFHFEAFIYP